MGLKYSQWQDWNDEDRVEWLFRVPEWSLNEQLEDLPEADATRLRGLIDQKWSGLSDDERVDLLIEGPQWMREGVRARVTPEDAARLEDRANSRWASMSDEEKIALLADQVNIGARETVLQQREPDTGRRQRLLQAANDRAHARIREKDAAWIRDHPEWRRRHKLDMTLTHRIRRGGWSIRSMFWRAEDAYWRWRTRNTPVESEVSVPHSQEITDLRRPDLSALPDFDGDNLDFVWDYVKDDEDDASIVISHRGETLWTEPAGWEEIARFEKVRDLLRDRYGDRLRFLLPTPRSEFALYGDSLTADDTAILINFPDLAGERLAFIASYESDELGGPHLHIRCGDRLVYRELSAPEPLTLWWLDHIEGLLRRRYGERFGSLTHAPDADELVYGGLPDLPGEKLDLEWDFTTGQQDRVMVLHAGTEIWRDQSNTPHVSEHNIESLLRARYGDRVASITRRDPLHDELSAPADEITDPQRLMRRIGTRDARIRTCVQMGTTWFDVATLHAENGADLHRLQQLLSESRGQEYGSDLGDNLLSRLADDEVADAQRLIGQIAERDDRMSAAAQPGASKSDVGSLYISNETDLENLRLLVRDLRQRGPGGYMYWLTDMNAPFRTDLEGFSGEVFSRADDAWIFSPRPTQDLWQSTPEEVAGMIGGRQRLTEPTKARTPVRPPPEPAETFAGEGPPRSKPAGRGARRLLRRLGRRLKR